MYENLNIEWNSLNSFVIINFMYRAVQKHNDIDLCSTRRRKILDFHLLNITELEILARFQYDRPFRKLSSEVFYNMYELIYVESGEQIHFVDNTRYKLLGGDLLIIRPGEEHSTGDAFENRGCTYWFIGNLEFETFLGNSRDYGIKVLQYILAESRGHVIRANATFPELLKKVFKYYRIAHKKILQKDPFTEVYIQHIRSILSEVFFYLYVTITEKTEKPDCLDAIVDIVKQYIADNIWENIDLEDLAQQVAHMSLPYLRYIFKKHVGFALRDYINYQKIEKSKLLLSKGHSITEIAMDLDFSSSQYFATVFRKYTGYTPSEYYLK